MISSRPTPLLILLTVVLLPLFNGCSTGVRETPMISSAEQRLRSQAQALETAGNYQGAAELYLQAAEKAAAPLRQDYLISGADDLVRAADYERAAGILAGIPPGGLPEAQQTHYHIVQARLDLAQNHPAQALERLQPISGAGPWQADYHRLRAEAYALDGNYFSSARERIALDGLLSDPQQKLENQLAIWSALTHLSDKQLQEMRLAPPPDVLSGWLELMELTRLYLQQPQVLAEVIPQWQKRYPGHPASGEFTTVLLQGMSAAAEPPSQVAVLLPLSGSLQVVSTAIRDGILAAYYDTSDGSRRPELRFYDVGANPADAAARYQQAVAEGARFVIGPLRKEAVQAVLQLPQLPVPLLTLNTIDTDAPANPAVYQFGLAPEDEARDAARRAWQDGQRRAISLTPQGDWGERVEAAFTDEWNRLGGTLLDHPTYDPAQADHSRVISAALNLDASKARHAALVRLLGRRLEFEPRRRQDVDFIFLLATPEQARLIRPQLSFFRAQRVPVYSTSYLYTGRPDRSRDFDLNGIRFCDMPWILETNSDWKDLKQSIVENWPDSAASHGRFYALGVDAYRIMPYLGRFQSGLFGAYRGATGNLTLDDRQVVHRTLVWAQFRNGVPQLIDTGVAVPAGNATPVLAE
jgi:outer membrane PBP1 activator LpoA protein